MKKREKRCVGVVVVVVLLPPAMATNIFSFGKEGGKKKMSARQRKKINS